MKESATMQNTNAEEFLTEKAVAQTLEKVFRTCDQPANDSPLPVLQERIEKQFRHFRTIKRLLYFGGFAALILAIWIVAGNFKR